MKLRVYFRIATSLRNGVATILNLQARSWRTQNNFTSFNEMYPEKSPCNCFVSFRNCKLEKEMCVPETSKITLLPII